MIQIDYKDILTCQEIDYPCFCGMQKTIVITNVPPDVSVNKEAIFSTGSGCEKISYSIIHEGDKVTVIPQTKADTLPKCMLLKNKLLLLPINDKDFLLRLRIKCSDDGVDYDKFMLVLDLGNTRTCALTCTTLWDPSANQQWKTHPLAFEPLTMRLNYKNDAIEVCNSIFSSKCVLGTNIHQDWTRSFIQLDKNSNVANPEVLDPNLRWYLSGPKRYFWQQDTLRVEDDYKDFIGATSKLHYLRPSDSADNLSNSNFVSNDVNQSYAYDLVPLDLPLSRAMSHRSFAVENAEREKAFKEGYFPYSIFLKGMLWELMEQAELQVNRRKNTSRPFRLSDLVVTFPAVWTTAEKEAYAKQIRETAELYAQQRCFDHEHECKINVDVNCDEGMAVFTTYLCSEYNKRTADQLIGKKVAVIDIGGGTSDLVIAEIGAEKNEILNTRYVVQPLYANGTYEAGDKFIHRLVETILLPSVIKKLFPRVNIMTYAVILEILSDVITSNNDPMGKEALKSFVFTLWYPAALDLLSIINDRYDNGRSNDLFHLNSKRQQNLNEFCDIIERHKKFVSLSMSGEKFTLYEGTGDEVWGAVELQLFNDKFKAISHESFREQMTVAGEKTFSATLKSFGDVIKKYECNRVLLSGKISDLDIVRDIFRKHLGDDVKLIAMNEYSYENMPTKDYIASDSKFATVTGAGLYRMARSGRLKGFDLKINDPVASEFIWGLYRDQQFYSWNEIEPVAFISYEKEPISIARKSSPEAPWIPSYELRPNPLKNVVIEKTVKFRFAPHSITPHWLSGCFILNGKRFELQEGNSPTEEQQIAFNEAFEFRICKLPPEENNKSQALSWLDSGMVFNHSNEERI